MNFWKFVDANGVGLAIFAILFTIIVSVVALKWAGKIGMGPDLCQVPCSEVHAK